MWTRPNFFYLALLDTQGYCSAIPTTVLDSDGSRTTEVLRFTKVHRLVVSLLRPAYETCSLAFQETAD